LEDFGRWSVEVSVESGHWSVNRCLSWLVLSWEILFGELVRSSEILFRELVRSSEILFRELVAGWWAFGLLARAWEKRFLPLLAQESGIQSQVASARGLGT
jgi:hypothetical protein